MAIIRMPTKVEQEPLSMLTSFSHHNSSHQIFTAQQKGAHLHWRGRRLNTNQKILWELHRILQIPRLTKRRQTSTTICLAFLILTISREADRLSNTNSLSQLPPPIQWILFLLNLRWMWWCKVLSERTQLRIKQIEHFNSKAMRGSNIICQSLFWTLCLFKIQINRLLRRNSKARVNRLRHQVSIPTLAIRIQMRRWGSQQALYRRGHSLLLPMQEYAHKRTCREAQPMKILHRLKTL